jgi:hypothetical protein
MIASFAFAGSDKQWVSVDRKELSQTLEALNRIIAKIEYGGATITTASYDDYISTTYHQRTEGYFKRSGNEYYSYMLGTRTIQDNDQRIVIDSSKKVICIADPTISMNNVVDAGSYASMLKACSSIQKAQWEGYTYYKMVFPPGQRMTSYEFSIKDSLLQRIVIYYDIEVKKGSKIKPRMEVEFSNWKTGTKYSADVFSIGKYVSKKGDDFYLKEPYAGKYKLLDERVLSKATKK